MRSSDFLLFGRLIANIWEWRFRFKLTHCRIFKKMQCMKRRIFAAVAAIFVAGVCTFAGEGKFKPLKLTVGEFYENPIGMSLENLKFWCLF